MLIRNDELQNEFIISLPHQSTEENVSESREDISDSVKDVSDSVKDVGGSVKDVSDLVKPFGLIVLTI